MSTIGQRIRTEREAQGLSRAELAAAAGMAKTTLADLEYGDSKSTTKLHKIAARLAVRVEWLETGRGVKQLDAPPLAAREEGAAYLSTGLPPAPAQPPRLDPEKIADTTEVLEVILGRRGGRTLDLKKRSHAELFAEAYAFRETLDDAPPAEFTATVIDLVTRMEERDRGERTGEQDGGTARGGARRAGAR